MKTLLQRPVPPAMPHDPYDHDIERGMRNRRQILGDAWVDASVPNANAFNADFQNFITRYAWHEIWGRPGLDPKTRRVIVLAVTSALGRWDEFTLHTRASLGMGDPATRLSPEEVKEVLMQVAIYAGVPAANTAMATTVKLLRELGHELPPRSAADTVHPGVGAQRRTAGRPALHYTVREARDVDRPRHTVVMAHALGADSSLWDGLANRLASDCRVVCYDHRGHGSSELPAGPALSMAALADDASRLIEELQAEFNCGPVVFVGLSLGGMVGQELALRRPELLQGLVLAHTSAGDPGQAATWAERAAAIEAAGTLDATAEAAMQRWFTPGFRERNPATVARWQRRLARTDCSGYLAALRAVAGHDSLARLPQIAAPTLVIAGAEDPSMSVAGHQALAAAIPGAQLQVLADAAHLGVIEQPQAFAQAVQGWLDALG